MCAITLKGKLQLLPLCSGELDHHRLPDYLNAVPGRPNGHIHHRLGLLQCLRLCGGKKGKLIFPIVRNRKYRVGFHRGILNCVVSIPAQAEIRVCQQEIRGQHIAVQGHYTGHLGNLHRIELIFSLPGVQLPIEGHILDCAIVQQMNAGADFCGSGLGSQKRHLHISIVNTCIHGIVKRNGKKQCNLYKGSFTATLLGKIETEMQQITGDNGELLAVSPDTILIPNDAALKDAVFAAIGADKEPTTSNNAYNHQFGRWNVIVDPYLGRALAKLGKTDAPWILLDGSYIQQNDGPIFQNRVKLAVRSEIDPNNDNNIWKGRGRFKAGFVDWRFALAGGMTGGSAL